MDTTRVEIIGKQLDKVIDAVTQHPVGQVKTYEELLVAQNKEEAELNIVYLYFSECYDKINSEMTKKM